MDVDQAGFSRRGPTGGQDRGGGTKGDANGFRFGRGRGGGDISRGGSELDREMVWEMTWFGLIRIGLSSTGDAAAFFAATPPVHPDKSFKAFVTNPQTCSSRDMEELAVKHLVSSLTLAIRCTACTSIFTLSSSVRNFSLRQSSAKLGTIHSSTPCRRPWTTLSTALAIGVSRLTARSRRVVNSNSSANRRMFVQS